MSCVHKPEYDSSVNETYCSLCLERLPNASKTSAFEKSWWLRQHILVRTFVYLLLGFCIGQFIGSFADG